MEKSIHTLSIALTELWNRAKYPKSKKKKILTYSVKTDSLLNIG